MNDFGGEQGFSRSYSQSYEQRSLNKLPFIESYCALHNEISNDQQGSLCFFKEKDVEQNEPLILLPLEKVSSTAQSIQTQPQLRVEQKKIKKTFKDKNIPRYLSIQIIRSMLYYNTQETKLICDQIGLDFIALVNYFEQQYLIRKNIEQFKSIQVLRKHWIFDANEPDRKIKMVFKIFSKWYLQEKSTRAILNGRMGKQGKTGKGKNAAVENGHLKDLESKRQEEKLLMKKLYLNYKNNVMLFFIDRPEKYTQNSQQHS